MAPRHKWVYWLLPLLLTTCSRKDTPAPIYQVPPEVEPYIQAFIQEASLRGKTITIQNLIVEFGPTPEEDICGVCKPGSRDSNGQHRIMLSTQSYCWQDAQPEEREELVFHELGHCILGRLTHKTSRLPNGDYASIMNGKEIGLYAPCVYDVGGTNNNCGNRYKRQYYLDELFDESAPVPDWGK